ncbi:uncharacterized protein PAC_05676 [Phialocephala subalpina]|uniref:Uncharacterized protein n=1 Tax=Phialocephala subalpina TaxID=576137 RepID=A0A1L7WSN9_9HELO|nr:uncharacterized protein PAC_05676 [Phialocephala subalpina]
MDDTTPSTISTPTYRIFRDKHGIPQFSPKRGTQGLKDALIYAFPTLETELQLMQAALKKFFDSEKGIHIIYIPTPRLEEWIEELESSKYEAEFEDDFKNNVAGAVEDGIESGVKTELKGELVCKGGSGRELDRKKKGPYDPVKRRKVAENRGNACDRHRAAKSACDPLTCPQNKMFGKLPVSDNTLSEPQAMRPRKSRDNVLVFESSVQNASSATDRPRTVLDDISNTTQGDFVTIPPGADVFWDPAEAANLNDAMLNFGHLSTSSYAGSWTDGSFTDLMSWSPNSSCLTAPDSTRGSLAGVPELPQQDSLMRHFDATQDQVDLRNAPLPIPHECPLQQYPSLAYPTPSDEASGQQPLAAPAQMDQTLTCSEDPFMGWASKKANQMIDDYGWQILRPGRASGENNMASATARRFPKNLPGKPHLLNLLAGDIWTTRTVLGSRMKWDTGVFKADPQVYLFRRRRSSETSWEAGSARNELDLPAASTSGSKNELDLPAASTSGSVRFVQHGEPYLHWGLLRKL